jgi:glycosyltransferase involved in cell wall biosynthesis
VQVKEIKLSVIVPVYKVEAYLERCIRSLEDQDLVKEEYEIIVVNDGSPDTCREITLRLAHEFSNLVLIDQENKGVSLARNAGIEKAKGDYLLFVDGDDYVLPQTLRAAVLRAEEVQAEVFFLGHSFLDSSEKVTPEVLHTEYQDKLYTGTAAYIVSRGNGKTVPDRSWGILYHKDFINRFNLRYVGGIPYLEDGEFMARALCMAERCAFFGKEFYVRVSRPGSATTSDLFYSDRAMKGFILAAQNLKKFQSLSNLSARQKEFLNQPICKFVLLVLTPNCTIKKLKKFRESVNYLKGAGISKIDSSGCNNYYKVEGTLYNIAPFLYFIHRLFRAPLLKLVKLNNF